MTNKTITAPAAQSNTVKPSTAAPTVGPANPFLKSVDSRTVAGVVAIESERAIAEAQGKLVLAKRFPRDQFTAFEAMRAACMRPGLADEAFYEYPRGGKQVRGASIRLAEELARCWGNIEYGMKELSNDSEKHLTEMQAFAWDLETNVLTTQQFTVRHIRDRADGGKELTDQRDIYEIGANMGSRRMRARILAVLPADFVDAAVQICTATILKNEANTPAADRAKKLIAHFATHGVTLLYLENFLGHSLSSITDDDFVKLRGIANALKDGAKPGDYFKPPELPQLPTSAPTAPAPTQEAPKSGTPAAAPTPAPATAAAAAPAPAAASAPAAGTEAAKKKGGRKANIVDVGADGQPLAKPADGAPTPEQKPAEAPAATPAAESAAPAATTEPAASAIEREEDDIFGP